MAKENTYFWSVLGHPEKEAPRATNQRVVLLRFITLSGNIICVSSPKIAILEAPVFSVLPNHALPLNSFLFSSERLKRTGKCAHVTK